MAIRLSTTGLVADNGDFTHSLLNFLDCVLRGVGQVMLQGNSYAGLLFLVGIFCNSPLFGLGALLGTGGKYGHRHDAGYRSRPGCGRGFSASTADSSPLPYSISLSQTRDLGVRHLRGSLLDYHDGGHRLPHGQLETARAYSPIRPHFPLLLPGDGTLWPDRVLQICCRPPACPRPLRLRGW